jgi:hypothetical protein
MAKVKETKEAPFSPRINPTLAFLHKIFRDLPGHGRPRNKKKIDDAPTISRGRTSSAADKMYNSVNIAEC